MWKPNLITSKKTKFDFSSSGQGVAEATQIYFDDRLFCNGVEFLELDGSSVQFIVCSHCGYARCEPGNFLTLRKCGEHVFLIPSFEEMEADDFDLHEFSAPYEVRKNGAIFLTKDQYAQLRSIVPGLNKSEELQPINMREVALLVQWEAPYRALGELPSKISLKRDLYLATESPLEDNIVKELFTFLKEFLASKKPAECIESSTRNSAIFLDTKEYSQWNPLTEVDGKLRLRLEPVFEFKREQQGLTF